MKLKMEAFEENIIAVVTQDVSDHGMSVFIGGLKKHVTAPPPWIYADFSQSILTKEAKDILASMRQVKIDAQTPASAKDKGKAQSAAAAHNGAAPPEEGAVPDSESESEDAESPSDSEAKPGAAPGTAEAAKPKELSDQELMPKMILIGPDPELFEFKSMSEALTALGGKEGLLILDKMKLQVEFDSLTRKKVFLQESMSKVVDPNQGKLSLFTFNHALKVMLAVLTGEVKRTSTKLNRLRKRPAPDPAQVASLSDKKSKMVTQLTNMKLLNS